MDAQDIDTATMLLLSSTLAAAHVGLDMSPNAGDAIQESVLIGAPVPPDYWPEPELCTGLLRELIAVLEGTA